MTSETRILFQFDDESQKIFENSYSASFVVPDFSVVNIQTQLVCKILAFFLMVRFSPSELEQDGVP